MFDWVTDAVSSAKNVWNDMTGGGGGGGSAQSGSSPTKKQASQAGSYEQQEQALSPNRPAQRNETLSYTGSGASGKANAGGGSWWDKLWGSDDKDKDEGPVHVPFEAKEVPEPVEGEESWWEKDKARKEAHNRKVDQWKAYEGERRVLMDKLAEIESRRGFLQRNPHNWSATYVHEQQIQVRQEEEAARASLAGLKEPPFSRPDPYDYYVITT